MEKPQTQFTTTDDISIAYQVIGDGPLDVVFAHGWVSNIEYAWESPHFAKFLHNLSRFCRLLFFDRRGTGLSDRDIGAPTLEERAQDIAAVMDAVGSKIAALLGVSEGGNMAAVFAATHPERTEALILYGSSAKGSWSPDYPWQIRPDEIEDLIQSMRLDWGLPFKMDEAAPSMVGNRSAEEWFSAYLRFSASPRSLEKITKLNAQIDIRAVLPTIRVPTLVISREGDKWSPPDEMAYLAKLVPDAELKILPGDDHLPWYGDQDALVAEFEEFLTGKRDLPLGENVLLTVLMTDLVGSTTRAVEEGDSDWQILLQQHNRIVERRAVQIGGNIIKSTGDGFLVTFAGPTRAIQCAAGVLSDLATIGLMARAGIHTGECQTHDGEVSGIAVHIAARLLEHAEGDQILATSTVKDLTVGSNVRFFEVGVRELKGVPGEWRLYLADGN